MKPNHPWRETFYEKLLFMNHIQNHSGSASHAVKHQLKRINFYFAAPRAKLVCLACDTHQWHPEQMERLSDGWWFVQAHLGHGHHQYRFLVDGEPTLDPHAPGMARDEHNEPVSVIMVV